MNYEVPEWENNDGAVFDLSFADLIEPPAPARRPRRFVKSSPMGFLRDCWHSDCPQHRCWGPWMLDSKATNATLYENDSATRMRIGLWWPDSDSPRRTNVPLVTLAFLVHIAWAGPWFTSGLLNAYTSIYGLTGYEPALAKMLYTEREIRTRIKAAIDNPVNLRHVASLDDFERASSHMNELARRAEEQEQRRQNPGSSTGRRGRPRPVDEPPASTGPASPAPRPADD